MALFTNLLRRARARDADALEQLLVHVEDRLRRFVDTRLGEKLRARMRESDVLQTAYVEVVRSIPKFRGQSEGEFVTWIMSIIENGIRRENRWFAARKRRMPESTTERNVLARLLLDPPATPSQEMMQLEERALFAAALQRLPQHYAEIIDLVLLQGMSHEDAALRMNKTASATRMLLSRARAALMTEVDRIERDSTS